MNFHSAFICPTSQIEFLEQCIYIYIYLFFIQMTVSDGGAKRLRINGPAARGVNWLHYPVMSSAITKEPLTLADFSPNFGGAFSLPPQAQYILCLAAVHPLWQLFPPAAMSHTKSCASPQGKKGGGGTLPCVCRESDCVYRIGAQKPEQDLCLSGSLL